MHRRHFMAAAPFVSAAVLSAPAFAQNAFDALPRISWRMSSSFLPQTDVIFDGATLFASVLSDLTSGRFTIDIHPANDLTPIAETFTKAKEGWFELAHTALPLHAADEPVLALMGGVPFGMNARQLDAFLSYAGGNDALNNILLDHQLYAVPMGSTGAQMGGWFRSELRSLNDLKGHKTIATGLAAQVLQRLGAQLKDIPTDAPNDVVTALKSGQLDSVSWGAPYEDEKLDLVKYAPHYYYPGWCQGAYMAHVLINRDVWSKLPAPYQAAIKYAATHVHHYILAHYNAVNPPALRRLVEAGARLKLFPQDIIDAALEATRFVMAQQSDKDAKFKRFYELYAQFRYDAYLWSQVSEYAFDNMNIRARFRG